VTILVGVRCTDGIVIGADSAATSAAGMQPLASFPLADKINIVGDRVIYACTGAVGLGQRVGEIIKDAHDDKRHFQKSCLDCCKEITRAVITDFKSTNVLFSNQHGWGFGTLVAAPFGSVHELVEFAPMDFQPEVKKDKLFFVSMGSGQPLADPFLAFVARVLWKNEAPTTEDAMFGVLWALSHTVSCAPGGGGTPYSLAMLKKDGKDWRARKLDEIELQEQSEHINAIENRIGDYPEEVLEEATASTPPTPPEQ
jgi:20S proteasome alpha/beta subunit